MKNKSTIKLFTLFFIFILLAGTIGVYGLAQDQEISITMRRNYGTDLGNKIGGDWTISGTAPENTKNIKILFNDQEVYNTTGNTFSFRFNTNDYEPGDYTIKVRAYYSENEFYERTLEYEFLDEKVDIVFLVIIIVIIAISVVVSILKYRKKKIISEKPVTLDEIRID